MFYKMCEKFGLKIYNPMTQSIGESTVSAREVELLLSSATVAWGMGNEKHFSLIHGEDLNTEGFELKGLVIGLEPTGNDTQYSLAQQLSIYVNNPSAWKAYDQGLSDLIEKLVKKVGK